MKKILAVIAACGFASMAEATCYTVYDKSGKMIYQSSDAPVDTRLEYHRTVPQRFGPGATIVYIGNEESCSPLGSLVEVSRSESNRKQTIDGQNKNRPKADRS